MRSNFAVKSAIVAHSMFYWNKNYGHNRREFNSDVSFDQVYPVSIQKLAARHWTPLQVIRKAANFLAVQQGAKVLDIGSGVGKFCLAAGFFKPEALFFGIEQRQQLCFFAETARQQLDIGNVTFLQGNFTGLDLRDYDHFYFYNSFYENLNGTSKIDDSLEYSSGLYYYYTRFLYKQLERTPSGTRLATFHSLEDEIPPDFLPAGSESEGLLKFWIKI